MNYNEEHIFQLILEKLSGDISDEDNRYLEQIARVDPNVRRCLEELEGARDTAGPDFMNDLHNERAWSSVLSLLHADEGKKSALNIPGVVDETPVVSINNAATTRFRNTWWLAAAVTILLAAGGYYLLGGRAASVKSDRGFDLAAGLPVWGDVRLLLEDGDTVRLTGDVADKIKTKRAVLHPGEDMLTFKPGKDAGGWNTLFVPTGKDYKVELSDGSVVHLNAFSRLKFPFAFDGRYREVYVEGEAYFDIADNADQPFIVHTPRTSVEVLGTSFNVNAYSESHIITSVLSGAVSSTTLDDDILLKPGQESVYRKGYHQELANFDENITLAWRKGEYTYYNQPLGTLDAVVFRWYGKQLLFEDPQLANKMLTGVIDRHQPVTEFLESLDKTSGITYRITDDKIYLRTK